jgi:pimeloyl-ACP methyl ester carboxylesterase
MAAVAETVATNGVSPTFREGQPDAFRAFLAMLEGNDPRGYAAQCRALVGLDLQAELGRITAPALLLSGDRDAVCPPAAAEANAGAMRQGRAETVEDCGHILPLERPDRLEAAVRPFLAGAA